MVDTLTPAQRSKRMSRIRSTDTKPEVALRRALHRLGFRFRLHGRRLPGRPDIVLTKYRTVIFVHGCFWHRHEGCKVATTPKSNTEFWIEKFSRNVARDAAVLDQLHAAQWRVIIAWECDLGSVAKLSAKVAEIAAQIRSIKDEMS
ncbi:DNA mismatch endonuclease Vsr [Paracoccus sp. CPCC 101403]|uniref:Very short patch repair endonuclease n=1 Tax=Paracoccus broussonetiae TaxID=3075834 RepID=A0ABU3EK80_9RHOB|nr:DNA mismatch endonuclease Vsr [Paracoccus sp. CPCC 101403]MDT1064662.1 DNA mismatch endonuclease Vsr [Paracoccus sp. CPCC 101403]